MFPTRFSGEGEGGEGREGEARSRQRTPVRPGVSLWRRRLCGLR